MKRLHSHYIHIVKTVKGKMKKLKDILKETNISAGIGVRGFGDITGNPATNQDSENSHIQRVVQGAQEYSQSVKSLIDNHNTTNVLDEPDEDNWWTKAKSKGSALTSMGKPIKTIKEEAPANAVGNAEVAGLGVGPKGAPGVYPNKTKYRKQNLETTDAIMGALNRRLQAPLFEIKKGKFAGNDTFIVPESVFFEARLSKKKGKHWTKYLNETDYGKVIREYANKNPKKPVILQCEKTGYMCYARYGSK